MTDVEDRIRSKQERRRRLDRVYRRLMDVAFVTLALLFVAFLVALGQLVAPVLV